jgi:hypothetical protein
MSPSLVQRLCKLGSIACAGVSALLACGGTLAGSASTLIYLSTAGDVVRMASDGSNRNVIVQGQGVIPDGIAIDAAAGHVYWTNMGKPNAEDGTILRADLNGKNVTTIVAAGGAFTPKQLKLDSRHRKLYWSDREGMRVMRANLDGSAIETLVITGSGEADRRDQSKWCVGIALDVAAGKVYWTQKGGDNAGRGSIRRANMAIPAGEHPARRSDIEVLFANLPEPIDLDLDLSAGMIYWTDRGDNTVSRAPMHPRAGFDPAQRADREILVRGLSEAIGIVVDRRERRMFYTSLGGEVGTASLDGVEPRWLSTKQGALTGIAILDSN